MRYNISIRAHAHVSAFINIKYYTQYHKHSINAPVVAAALFRLPFVLAYARVRFPLATNVLSPAPFHEPFIRE